ncbi:MAG: RICIN domain-containing protein, partial [Pseudonocardiaceae bacterium]
LGLRADFFGRCAVYPELVEAVRRGPLMLAAMTDPELRAAIAKPAHAVGLDLEPGLEELMLADLGFCDEAADESSYRPGSLPLLAHALLATWQQRDGGRMTIAGYRLVGGISGAIAKTAERAYRMLQPDQQEIARSVLLRMIQLGDGADDTRRQVERAHLVAEPTDSAGVEKVLNALVDARLVTTDETTVEIVHEILLRAWPRLRQWIDADREELLLQQRLAEAAKAWDRDGRHESDLYRGHRLAALRERLDAADPCLPALTSEFLHASVGRERADELAVARRGRLRTLIAVLSALVLMATTATVFAVQSRNDAVEARNDAVRLQEAALSREVSATAIGLRAADPALAAQLASAAYDLSQTAEARGAVLSALVNLDLPRRANVDSQTAVDTVAFNSDGRLLVAASRETSIWKLGDRPSLADPPIAVPHPHPVRSAVLSHDDKLLATSSTDHIVRLWAVDALRGAAQPEPILTIGPVLASPLVFSRDNRLLVTGGATPETIRLWELTADGPRLAGELSGHTREVLSVAISPDGRYLASAGGSDRTARLWDITEPRNPVSVLVEQDMDDVYDVAFSPDGNILATGNGDTTARLFDVSDRQHPRALPRILDGHSGPVTGVAFSADRKTLVTTSQDTTARLWNVSDPDHPELWAAPLAGNNESVESAAFSPDLHTLALAGRVQDVRLWETDVDRAVTEICEAVSSPLSPEQWDGYFRGQAYKPPCPGRAAKAATAEPPAGSTTLVALNSGKCVAIKDDGASIGASAHQIDCTDARSANWTLPDEPAAAPGNTGDRIVQIVNAASGMCLESADAERRIGGATQVVQRPCKPGNGSQLWILNVLQRRADSVDVMFRGLKHRDCLNINRESTASGAYVIRWECNEPEPHENEIFRVHPDAVPP